MTSAPLSGIKVPSKVALHWIQSKQGPRCVARLANSSTRSIANSNDEHARCSTASPVWSSGYRRCPGGKQGGSNARGHVQRKQWLTDAVFVVLGLV